MIHFHISFTEENGGFGYYTTHYFPTKNFKVESVFELVYILDNDIREFIIKKQFIKKDHG